MTMTWREYADKVEAVAAGLAGLGPRAGRDARDHAHEPARVPLVRLGGAARRRHAVLDLQHLRPRPDPVPGEGRRGADRGHRGGLPRPGGGPRRRGAPRGDRRGRPRGLAVGGRRGGRGARGLRLRGLLARRLARRPAHADLHLGHHRAAQGRPDHAREPALGRARLRRDDRVPGRGPGDLLAADGAHRGARLQPLPADGPRADHNLLPGPAPGRGVPARGAPVVVLRRAADLGEAEGGHRGRRGRGAGRRAQAGDRVGARRGPAQGARRAGRGGGAARARRGAREGGRARALEDP